MSTIAEIFPMDGSVNHVDFFKRLNAFTGNIVELNTYAIENITKQELIASQIIAFTYRKDVEVAKLVREMIASYLLPLEVSLRLLTTCVVPFTPATDLVPFIQERVSPFLRDRMVRLLKKSKRHDVVDALLTSSKLSHEQLSAVYHMASSPKVDETYLQYHIHIGSGLNIVSVLRFHQQVYLDNMMLLLDNSAWQMCKSVWDDFIFNLIPYFTALDDEDLVEEIFKLYLQYPPCDFVNEEFKQVEDVDDKYKTLCHVDKMVTLANVLSFDRLHHYLTSNDKLTEPSVLWITYSSLLWKNLMNRSDSKGEQVKKLSIFLCDKVENISSMSSLSKHNIIQLDTLQQKHWNELFSYMISASTSLVKKAGSDLTNRLLQKIKSLWSTNLQSMTFLTSSQSSLMLKEEMFNKFESILLRDVFTLLQQVERAITGRVDSLLKSFVNNPVKANLFRGIGNDYQLLFAVYHQVIADIIELAKNVNVEYLVSFHHMISKTFRSVISVFDAIRLSLTTSLRKTSSRVTVKMIQVDNAEIDSFVAVVCRSMQLASFETWIQSWWSEVESYLLAKANPSVSPTILSTKMFTALLSSSQYSDVIAAMLKEYLPWEKVEAWYAKLRGVIRQTTDLLHANPKAYTSYYSDLRINAIAMLPLLRVILNRILCEQSSSSSTWYQEKDVLLRSQVMAHEIVLSMYEMKQWGDFQTQKGVIYSLTQAKYYDSMSFLQVLMERELMIPQHLVITLDQLLSEDVSNELASVYTVLFTDMRKDMKYPSSLFGNISIKPKFYLALQALVIKMVYVAVTKKECSMMLDMFHANQWNKENASSTVNKKSMFDELFIDYLPMDDSRVSRYLKRRVLLAVNVEEKLVLYTALINAAYAQNQAWSNIVTNQVQLMSAHNTNVNNYLQQDYFLQATQFVMPMIQKIAFNSKGLSYPVEFNNFLDYIPSKEDILTTDVLPRLTAPRVQQVLDVLQSICDARFQTEATSYSGILDGMIDRMFAKAWQSYVDLIQLAEVSKYTTLKVFHIDHCIAMTQLWLDLLVKLHFVSFERVHGQKHARCDYKLNERYYKSALEQMIEHGYDDSRYWTALGVSQRNYQQSIRKDVVRRVLQYVWSSYQQYATEMPLTPAIYRARGELMTSTSIDIMTTHLNLALSCQVYDDAFGLVDMIQVWIDCLTNEEEYTHNFEQYRSVADAFVALPINRRSIELKKLTLKKVLFDKSELEEDRVLDVAEISLLKLYKKAVVHDINPSRFQHFPTIKLMFINRRIAEFDAPQRSNVEVLLDSVEEVCEHICPSILRYKFICQLLIEHRPQVIFKYLPALGVNITSDNVVEVAQEEGNENEEEDGSSVAISGKKHAILIKRSDAFSLPFTPRKFKISTHERNMLATLSRTIILDHEKSSLLHRRRAVDWLTSLKVTSLDDLLKLYQQMLPDPVSSTVLPPVLKKTLLINGMKSSSADIKTLLETIFRPELFNDADLTLSLIQLLTDFAKIYGQVFTQEIQVFLQPQQPMFAKMGVTTFKAIIRLCENLFDAAKLLLSFWNQRQSLHRDVQTTILNTMLNMYITEEEERLRVGSNLVRGTMANAIYDFAKSMTVKNDLDIELFRTLLRVKPSVGCVESAWHVACYRAPQTTDSSTWLEFSNAQLSVEYFDCVVKPFSNRIFEFPLETFDNVVECIKTWLGVDVRCTGTIRKFFFHMIEKITISLPNNGMASKSNHVIESLITRRCFDYLRDMIAVSKKTFNQNNTDPMEEITNLFKQYMQMINQPQLTRAEQYSYMQKIRMMQDVAEFKVHLAYKTIFEPQEMDELDSFYSTMAEMYKDIKRKKNHS